ncbi:MAG: ABC transporter ATP-binding protein [Candidatus Zixiibacteriota bacterium]
MKKVATKLENVSKEFFDGKSWRTVLKDINFEVYTQEFTIIAGPSGSGKTTLLTIMGLILSPTRGNILINSDKVSSFAEDELATLRMRKFGFVFQHADLIPSLNVMENILIPSSIQGGTASRQTKDKAQKLLEEFGLLDYINAMPQQLSAGQRQRVAIARAMVNDPVLLFCDEPTSALDVESSTIVLNTLKKLSRDENRGVVMVTHDPRVFPYADRMIKLENGEVIYDSRNGGGDENEKKS